MVTIPHGGLGTGLAAPISLVQDVAIPRGGLGTLDEKELIYLAEKLSPSHTVGLEQVVLEIKNGSVYLSPSHTVGSERETIPSPLIERGRSPSHTVGSEPAFCSSFSFTITMSRLHPTRWAQNQG